MEVFFYLGDNLTYLNGLGVFYFYDDINYHTKKGDSKNINHGVRCHGQAKFKNSVVGLTS